MANTPLSVRAQNYLTNLSVNSWEEFNAAPASQLLAPNAGIVTYREVLTAIGRLDRLPEFKAAMQQERTARKRELKQAQAEQQAWARLRARLYP